jgi:hypothetical protein
MAVRENQVDPTNGVEADLNHLQSPGEMKFVRASITRRMLFLRYSPDF